MTKSFRVALLTSVALFLGSGAAQAEAPLPPAHSCDQGMFCTWSGEHYAGDLVPFELRTTNPEECVALPAGTEGLSFANRLDRHVTIYQDEHCATVGDFSTYPGGGTFVPQAPFVVRAIQIWN